ncbi:MAG: CdaR family protein [bacterium]
MNKNLKNIKNILRGNSWLKIISLFIAIFIWIYVIGGKKYDINLHAGLKIYALPKGLAISNTLPKKIIVKLRGSKVSFMKLNKKIYFRINGSSLLSKKNTLILSQSYLDLPSNIRVIRIYPKIIPVIISRIVVKYIKVLPLFKGKLKMGYYLKNISFFPQYIKVKGPKDIVDNLSVITTKKININNLKRNALVRINLVDPTKFLKILYNKKININLVIGRIKKNA